MFTEVLLLKPQLYFEDIFGNDTLTIKSDSAYPTSLPLLNQRNNA
jgi:hypothetical protein